MKAIRIKKINFYILTTLLLASFVVGNFVFALEHGGSAIKGLDITAGAGNVSKIGQGSSPTTGLTTFLGLALNYAFTGVAIIFFVVISIGGYFWMTARGSEEQIGKAKKFIINGFFGLLVVFLSYGLVYVILWALNKATSNV